MSDLRERVVQEIIRYEKDENLLAHDVADAILALVAEDHEVEAKRYVEASLLAAKHNENWQRRAEEAEAREAALVALMCEAMIEQSEPPYRIEFIRRWRAALR